jgi:cytochrome c5
MVKRLLCPLVLLWFVAFFAAEPRIGAQARGGQPAALPEGAGKDLVQTTCSKCHALTLITNGFGYTRADWDKVVGSMVAIPQPDRDAVIGYLAANFPEKNRPKSVIVPGKVQV